MLRSSYGPVKRTDLSRILVQQHIVFVVALYVPFGSKQQKGELILPKRRPKVNHSIFILIFSTLEGNRNHEISIRTTFQLPKGDFDQGFRRAMHLPGFLYYIFKGFRKSFWKWKLANSPFSITFKESINKSTVKITTSPLGLQLD